MKLLILGGTAFLGRAIATTALAGGHDVTCLARGTAPAPDGVALVRADRDAGAGLAEVAGEAWDAVVDVTRQPGQARRAVRELTAQHWVFVSSGNVYARFDRPDQDESSELLPALATDVMADMSTYCPAKVACEGAVRDHRDGWTIIRAGLIGGAGDWSGRSGYYPWRFAHPTGEDILVPDDLDFPCALLDVADLATWIVDCAEQRVHGVFNVAGPTSTLADFLDTAREVAGSSARVRPVPAEALTDAGVTAWMGPASLPLWIDDPTWRYFATLDTSAARAQGLRTRPLRETLAAALAYENERTDERSAGLSDQKERELRDRLT